MKITLTEDEIYEALMDAIEKKTSHTLGTCDRDGCFFTITDFNHMEIDLIESVEFTCSEFL